LDREWTPHPLPEGQHARLREADHHARHERGWRFHVAQRRQLLDRLLGDVAAAVSLQCAAHGNGLTPDSVNPWRSTISRSIARARTTRIFKVVIGSCRMPRISSYDSSSASFRTSTSRYLVGSLSSAASS